MGKILIVEDDHEVNRLLTELLEQNEFEVISSYNGLDAIQKLGQHNIDLVLLDLMLPGISGEDVLNVIRTSDKLPVIIVSAKNSLDEKVRSLREGADDYITKPFHTEEILARIESCLRRAKNQDPLPKILAFKDIVLNTAVKSAELDGKSLGLTMTEYKLLETMVLHPQRSFSKKQLFETGWREKYLYNDDIINTHMSNLRKKIKLAGGQGEYIETIFGLGYKLCK